MIRTLIATLLLTSAAPLAAQTGGTSELYSFAFYFRTPARTGLDYFDVMRPGDAVDVGATVRVPNEGSPAPAGASTAALVLSTDRYYSPDDRELHRWRVPALGRGEAFGYFVPPSVVVPDVPFGFYYLLFVIDVDEEVAEHDESNLDTIQLNVGGTYYRSPDLIGDYDPDYGLGTERARPGERVSIRYGVVNQTSGTYGEASGPFTVGYTLKRAYVGPAPVRLLGEERFQSLDPGEDEAESEQFTVPADTPPGSYVVCTELDLDNEVVEYNESNSVCYRLAVADPQRRPFLTVPESNLLRLPRTLGPGASIRVFTSVHNRGENAAPAAALGVVLSRDGAYSPDDYVLARVMTPAVPAPTTPGGFGSVRVDQTVIVPPGVPPGAYTVILVPDVDNVAGLPPGMRQFYGIYHATVPGGVGAEPDEVPGLTLEPPRPNPTAGGARLAFTLGAAGPVRVVVQDALGRSVAVLLDGVQPAGEQTVDLTTGRLAPGVYVVRLTAGAETRTQRLTVVR